MIEVNENDTGFREVTLRYDKKIIYGGLFTLSMYDEQWTKWIVLGSPAMFDPPDRPKKYPTTEWNAETT